MTSDQKKVVVGAASGIVAMAAAMWALAGALPVPEGADEAAGRIAYALRWNALAVLPLVAMIATVGNARFASEAIDPTRSAESPKMIVDGRVADNTLQQYALFLTGSLALAASLPAEWLPVVGAAAIVFAAMRIAFWIGYRIHPLYRAFGFSSTFYLNLAMLLAALWLAVR